jgi:hypothetical protein
MVIHGCFSSTSGVADDAILFLGGTTLIYFGRARTPSMVVQEVTDLYFGQVTSPNLLVFTSVSTSWSFGGRRLISFVTLISF